MKRSYIILLAICFTIALSGCADQTDNGDTSTVTSVSADAANTDDFVFTDGPRTQLISEDGASISILDSLPVTVIKSAEEFIINNDCNDRSFLFGFENSPKLGSPKGSACNTLDFFDPTVFEEQEDGSPYFVYQIGKDDRTYLGYFVIDHEGEIIEHNVITGEQYSKIDPECSIDIWQARDNMAEYFSLSNENAQNVCKYLDTKDNKFTLCYRGIFLSDDKTKKYYARMNSETGEIFYTDEVKFQ